MDKYKRFTDLTIENIPETAKLIVLIGPNGCGKSSLFDSFKSWQLYKGFFSSYNDDYCRKDTNDRRFSYNLVNVDFYDDVKDYKPDDYRQTFYFRTAYRNSPEISVKALQHIASPLEKADNRMMIQNDSTMDENYQRLVSATFSHFFDEDNDERPVKEVRDEILNKVRAPINRLFPDLLLTEIGMVTEKAEFYFSKGATKRYGYEKLSGGEKAAFDLLLDFVVKSQFYQNTVFCIDEPETHIHTSLQAKLLSELYNLISDNSQLWIATHSFGMMKEAKRLSETNPGQVVFLNFDGFDFDEPVVISPSGCDSVLWNKMLEIALDEYAPLLSPETIVFCEGSIKGRKRKDFDSRCYSTIFGKSHANTMFYSLGGCEDVENETHIIDFVSHLSPSSATIKLIDRDDRSPEEISDLMTAGVRVLSRRHIESYLLDDEVLKKWCIQERQPEKEAEILAIKSKALTDSINRGNAPDDLKSAANDICTNAKKALGVTSCGNNGEMIMRDTLAKLITPDMAVYQELESDIFS